MAFKQLTILVSAFAVGVLFWLLPERETKEDIVEVSPIALYVIDECVEALLQNQPLDEAEVLKDVGSIIEKASSSFGGTFSVKILDDFNCEVVVPHLSYDPRNLRVTLEMLKDSSFADRATSCRWSGGHRDGFVISTLGCRINKFSERRVIRYYLNISMQAKGEAIFSLTGFSVDGTNRF